MSSYTLLYLTFTSTSYQIASDILTLSRSEFCYSSTSIERHEGRQPEVIQNLATNVSLVISFNKAKCILERTAIMLIMISLSSFERV
jgi:hypothetical protein